MSVRADCFLDLLSYFHVLSVQIRTAQSNSAFPHFLVSIVKINVSYLNKTSLDVDWSVELYSEHKHHTCNNMIKTCSAT